MKKCRSQLAGSSRVEKEGEVKGALFIEVSLFQGFLTMMFPLYMYLICSVFSQCSLSKDNYEVVIHSLLR